MTADNNKRYSFEFFPPRTDEGHRKLAVVRRELALLNPAFFSVTYGAGGSTRDNTRDTVLAIKQEGLSVAPHLSFGADNEASILALVQQYQAAGIDRIVALRGDVPSGMGASRSVYASELVSFLRQKTGDHFHLEVAAYPEIHPEAAGYVEDITFLKQKFDAGANSAITQYFYNADAYFNFMEDCIAAGIDKPIYPGIMPITNYANLARFSANSGAEIPRWLAHKLESFGDHKQSIVSFGEEFVTRFCEKLLAGGAPGLHFYTMNQTNPSAAIWRNLSLS
jgi:methylenetetrahydrofolate reductase (NADPH)